MDQCVSQAFSGKRKPVVCADDFPARQEDNFDQIFKTATDHFDIRAVSPATQHRAALALQPCAVGSLEAEAVGLAQCDVKPAVRTKGESVQAAVVGVAKAAQDDAPLVGPPVAIRILKCDDIRRVGDKELAFTPDEAHWENQSIGKHEAALVAAIAIAVFEQADAAFVRELPKLIIEIQTRRLSDKKPPAFIEAGEHRELNLRRASNAFNAEAVRQLEGGLGRRC